MMQKPEPQRQRALLNHWLKSLVEVSGLDVIWLEGSLAHPGRANPSSDIDIRFGIADEAFDELWKSDRTLLTEGLGEYLSLHQYNFRFLTAEGIVVEMAAFRISELDGKELYEWEILFCRLPEEPKFKQLTQRSIAENWPPEEELMVEKFRRWSNNFIHELSRVPATFYNGELLSAWAVLDWVREELLKIFYLRVGVQYPARSKHFSEVFPAEFLSDLSSTYQYYGDSAVTTAKAVLHIFDVLGKHLRAASDQIGGGFEAEWYDRLYGQVRDELEPFMND